MTPRCDLVLPCRDEAAALPGVIASVPDTFRVIVVDNGSTDGTADVARSLGAEVVEGGAVTGYGAAVHSGLVAATADHVAVMDGDGSIGPPRPCADARRRRGRPHDDGGRETPSERIGCLALARPLGNAVVLAWLRHRTGLAVHDIAPMRVVRRQDLLDLDVQDRRFGYPVELLVKAQAAGWTLTEHDISYRPRAEGTRSKVSGSVTGTLRTARDFARMLP